MLKCTATSKEADSIILKNKQDNYDTKFYMGSYHAYWKWEFGEKVRNSRFDDFSSTILDFKKGYAQTIEHFRKSVAKVIASGFPVCVVPSHMASSDNSASPTARLAKGLVESNNLIDATNCILRVRSIQKLSKGGDRGLEVHLNSVKVVNSEVIKGKTVLLLDDVMTTGNSLSACRQLLLDAGAENVLCLALAQTVR